MESPPHPLYGDAAAIRPSVASADQKLGDGLGHRDDGDEAEKFEAADDLIPVLTHNNDLLVGRRGRS